uniref:Globin CTT-Y n=1 Tax=Chironomus thummi piger TaxID=7156 RepID=GLBY_CHITP|nr:RecName: Full=Globin CTT-Y; AltName: Full=HBY; Flags: Precursor [Chironomus piger]CAA39720.1 Ctp HbY [Chironomus thummi]
MKVLAIFALCIIGALATPCDDFKIMQEAWNTMKNEEVEILYTVFKAYPDIQAKFPQFVGKDLETIKGTAEFAVHATRIVSFMTEVISLLGNPDNLPAIMSLLSKLGKDHKGRGITVKQFDEFHEAFHNFLHTHSVWNDNVDAAWHCNEKEIRKVINANLE